MDNARGKFFVPPSVRPFKLLAAGSAVLAVANFVTEYFGTGIVLAVGSLANVAIVALLPKSAQRVEDKAPKESRPS